MVGKCCCAYGCKRKTSDRPKFYSFPECRQRCREWLQALNRPDILADISGNKKCLLNFYYVCDAHFSKNKDTPALLVASKATATDKTTNMEDTGACTDETNMEDTGTNTEKTNMDDKGTWTKKTKMKHTGTSTVDLRLSRLSLTPVDIIDIQPLSTEVIPASNVPTKPLVPVTNAHSPGFASAEPNVTRVPEYIPEKPTSTSPKPLEVPVAKGPSPVFDTVESNVPAKPTTTTNPESLMVPVDKTPSPGLITAEPNVTRLPAYDPVKPTNTSLKPLMADTPSTESIAADPNVTNANSTIGVGIIEKAEKSLAMLRNATRLGNRAANEIWKNSLKSYDTRIRSTTKVAPSNAPLLGHTEKDDIWKNSFKSYDTRIRPATTKVVPPNTRLLGSMVAADDIWKNSVTSYDTRIRPSTTKAVPSHVPSLGPMVSDDIWKNLLSSNDSRIRSTLTKVPPSNRPQLGCSLADEIWKNSVTSYDSRTRPTTTKDAPSKTPHNTPIPDIWKNSVPSNDTQIHPTTSSLRNFRKNIVPTIAVQKIHTNSNVTTQVPAEEPDETINTSETNSPEIKIEPEDTSEITIEEHPLDYNAIAERKNIRTPEIKTEPVTNEVNLPEIKIEESASGPDVEESALGLDDVFNAISERERNSQRLDKTMNLPNLTFKLQMNLPGLQALTSTNNLRRDLETSDVDENVRTYKRKRKDT